MGVTLATPPNRSPIIGNNGAEMMALNVAYFADLGLVCVPKRHSDSLCMRVPIRHTY